jgi:hypothetical protein
MHSNSFYAMILRAGMHGSGMLRFQTLGTAAYTHSTNASHLTIGVHNNDRSWKRETPRPLSRLVWLSFARCIPLGKICIALMFAHAPLDPVSPLSS